MGAYIQMAVVGALCGFIVGSVWQKLLTKLPVLVLSALCIGIFISKIARQLPPEEYYYVYNSVAVAACGTVLFLIIGSDDDSWKRFRKKTSEALKKLLAKVKELAPTSAPKPLPA